MNAPHPSNYVVEAMLNDEYHATPALGSSGLKALAESPFHYWAEYLNPERPLREDRPAFLAGTLAHCAILEPDMLDARYVVRPEGIDLRTKDGKAWAASVDPSLTVITAEQHATAMAQRAAVLAVPELAQLLEDGRAEQSGFWTDPATGVACKCRPDHVRGFGAADVVLDLKTTSDASPAGFAKSIAAFQYHMQAAWYSRGWAAASGREVAGFVFAAVSNAYPYVACAYALDDDAMRRGADRCDELLQRYVECRERNEWPAYGEGVQVLSLPPWLK